MHLKELVQSVTHSHLLTDITLTLSLTTVVARVQVQLGLLTCMEYLQPMAHEQI